MKMGSADNRNVCDWRRVTCVRRCFSDQPGWLTGGSELIRTKRLGGDRSWLKPKRSRG